MEDQMPEGNFTSLPKLRFLPNIKTSTIITHPEGAMEDHVTSENVIETVNNQFSFDCHVELMELKDKSSFQRLIPEILIFARYY